MHMASPVEIVQALRTVPSDKHGKHRSPFESSLPESPLDTHETYPTATRGIRVRRMLVASNSATHVCHAMAVDASQLRRPVRLPVLTVHEEA